MFDDRNSKRSQSELASTKASASVETRDKPAERSRATVFYGYAPDGNIPEEPSPETLEKALSMEGEELPEGIPDLVDRALTCYTTVSDYLRNPRKPGGEPPGVMTIAEVEYNFDLLGRILQELARVAGPPAGHSVKEASHV